MVGKVLQRAAVGVSLGVLVACGMAASDPSTGATSSNATPIATACATPVGATTQDSGATTGQVSGTAQYPPPTFSPEQYATREAAMQNANPGVESPTQPPSSPCP